MLAWRSIQLTDEERMLRDLAYPLIEPPYDRTRSRDGRRSCRRKSARQPASRPRPDRYGLCAGCSPAAYRSQTARYNRLIEDIRNDVMRLDPFFDSAR